MLLFTFFHQQFQNPNLKEGTEGGTSRETCARHVRRAISLASFNLEGYKLAWANPCPNPGHTPICSQIGKEMPEKSLVNWKFSNFLEIPSLCHIQPISAIFCPKEDSPRPLSHVECTNIQAAQAIVSREVHTTVLCVHFTHLKKTPVIWELGLTFHVFVFQKQHWNRMFIEGLYTRFAVSTKCNIFQRLILVK